MTLFAKSLCAVRSALFFIGFGFVTIFISLSGIIFTWFLPFHIRGRYFVLGNAAIIFLLRVCCGVKTEVRGTLPKDRPFVAMAKHQSQWETFYLQWSLFPVATVVKRELLNIPFFRWALRFMNAIGIDRSNPRAAMKQLNDKGLARLRNNYSLLIFPEGTRTLPGVRGRYARSGASIAIAAGVAVVPIAHNGGVIWPAKSMLIRPGTVTLVIGDAIASTDRESRELTLEVENWIEDQCAQMS